MNFFVMGTTSLDVGKLLVVVGCAVGSVGANGGEAGHFGELFWVVWVVSCCAGVFLVVFRFKKNQFVDLYTARWCGSVCCCCLVNGCLWEILLLAEMFFNALSFGSLWMVAIWRCELFFISVSNQKTKEEIFRSGQGQAQCGVSSFEIFCYF